MRLVRGLILTAAGLAAATIAVRCLDAATERRHPRRGRMIAVDGERLHAVVEGRGPPVILLHGNGGLADDFVASGLVDLLSRHHRVIAFDRPGFGYSGGVPTRSPEAQAVLLRRAAVALGAERPVIVGHSSGALVAVAWGLAAPWEVAGLVLLAGYLSPERERELGLLRIARLPLVGPVLRAVAAPLFARLDLRRIVAGAFAPQSPSEGFRREVPRGLLVRRTHVTAVLTEGADLPAAARRLGDRFGALPMPVVVFVAGGDRVIDWRSQVGAAGRMPHAQVHVVPTAGHMIHHVAPDAIAAAVDNLRRHVAD